MNKLAHPRTMFFDDKNSQRVIETVFFENVKIYVICFSLNQKENRNRVKKIVYQRRVQSSIFLVCIKILFYINACSHLRRSFKANSQKKTTFYNFQLGLCPFMHKKCTGCYFFTYMNTFSN